MTTRHAAEAIPFQRQWSGPPLVLALHTADMMATEAEKAREQG